MQTRSQTKRVNFAEFEVNIDFDGASAAWNSNKKRRFSGQYEYICGNLLKTGGYCKNSPYKNHSNCHLHK